MITEYSVPYYGDFLYDFFFCLGETKNKTRQDNLHNEDIYKIIV